MTDNQYQQIIEQIQALIHDNNEIARESEHLQEMYAHYGDGLQDALDIINKVMQPVKSDS